MNSVVFLSQAKSLVQAARGNWDEALETQLDYRSKGLGISQAYAGYLYMKGNYSSALSVWLTFIQRSNLIIQLLILSIAIYSPNLLMQIIVLMGFTRNGIVSGSLASSWMSGFHGHIPSSSLLARLQAIGQHQQLPYSWTLISVMVGAMIGPLPAILFLAMNRKESITSDEESRLLEDSSSNLSAVSLD